MAKKKRKKRSTKARASKKPADDFSNKAVLIMLVLVVFVTVVSLVFYLGALQKAGLGLNKSEDAVSIGGKSYTSPDVIKKAAQSETAGVVSLTIEEQPTE